MKVQTDVDTVLPPPRDGLVDITQRRFQKMVRIAFVRPAAVGHREADKVESPVRHPLEVGLEEWLISAAPLGGHVGPLVRCVGEFFLKVEAAPSRQLRVRGGRQQSAGGSCQKMAAA